MSIKQTFQIGYELARADFRSKTEGTWIGIMWYAIIPIFTFIVIWGVFTNTFSQNIPKYPIYILLGIVLFNYFQKITEDSSNAVAARSAILKSANFPRHSIIIAVLFKTLFAHIFEFGIMAILFVLFKQSLLSLLWYPLILIVLTAFSVGVGFILCSIKVYFNDIEYLWTYGLRLIWFATPIFYALDSSYKLKLFNMFNPMYYYITAARDVIAYNQMPDLIIILGCFVFAIITLIIGMLLFNKLKHKFVEYM